LTPPLPLAPPAAPPPFSGIDRDALAGWGAVVYVIDKEKGVIARTLKGRMD
jgi:hypothetical protein